MAADLPAELREAAGKAAHALRCKQSGPDHAPKDCPLRCGALARCMHCDPLLADWPDLTEAQRETFRASQDAGLSVVAPVMHDALAVARNIGALHEHAQGCWGGAGSGFAGCDCGFSLAAPLAARLAALGVK